MLFPAYIANPPAVLKYAVGLISHITVTFIKY